jgi:threonine dehydrogenase-like Zn-dependent dehydrogenase
MTAPSYAVPSEKVPSTMQAAVFAAPGKIEVRAVAVPAFSADDVLVRLEGCGVCASNLPLFEGRDWFQYPQEPGLPGHEGWGRVAAVGANVHDIHVGDRVAMLSYHAYAEYDAAPRRAVVRLPEVLDGKPFPGEPLGCAINIVKRADIQPNQTVAIVGIGFLGAQLIQLVQPWARVIAIAHRPYAQQVARDFGAAEVIPMDDHWRIIEQVKAVTDGIFCDRVIEATGKQWPLDLAAELTRERGKLIIAGYHQDGLRQVNMQLWNWRGLDVINAHEREQQVYIDGIQAAVKAVVDGSLDPFPLYTHHFPLARLDEALRMTAERPEGFMKAVITL